MHAVPLTAAQGQTDILLEPRSPERALPSGLLRQKSAWRDGHRIWPHRGRCHARRIGRHDCNRYFRWPALCRRYRQDRCRLVEAALALCSRCTRMEKAPQRTDRAGLRRRSRDGGSFATRKVDPMAPAWMCASARGRAAQPLGVQDVTLSSWARALTRLRWSAAA
jgi:hypothetical protein